MLYNTDFLNEDKKFPPFSELARLKRYKDNRKLFRGDTEQVLKPYKERMRKISERFSDVDVSFKADINFHRLITLKTGDLVCGEPPTISTVEEKSDKLTELLNDTDFNSKLLEAVYDISRLGESIARIKLGYKNNFVLINPDMWFPVVSREDEKEVLKHVICWIEHEDINGKTYYKLCVQEHERGRYISYVRNIKKCQDESMILPDGQDVTAKIYTLGGYTEKPRIIDTGLDDFAVVQLPGVTLPDDIHGIDDYEPITSLVAELEVRYALESLILDKHSSPTLAAPVSGLVIDDYTGEWKIPTGGIIGLQEGSSAVPQYVTWDASLQANHVMIEKIEKLLYSLTEMGAIINDDAFGASQGFEALETRLTNAKLKARRLTSKLTKPIKKLLHLIAKNGYGEIEETDISVYWNDGLPQNEYREADIALKKQPFFTTKTLLKEHFGKSEEDAEAEASAKAEENINGFNSGFSVGLGGGANEEE